MHSTEGARGSAPVSFQPLLLSARVIEGPSAEVRCGPGTLLEAREEPVDFLAVTGSHDQHVQRDILGCLASELPLSLALEFGETGYGDSRPEAQRLQRLRVFRAQGDLYVEGGVYRPEEEPLREVPKVPLTTEQAQAIRMGILAALWQPSASECNVADAETVAKLRIRCTEEDKEIEKTLVAPGSQAICNGSRFAGEPRRRREPFYDPAIGVGEFAREVLVEVARAARVP